MCSSRVYLFLAGEGAVDWSKLLTHCQKGYMDELVSLLWHEVVYQKRILSTASTDNK